MTVKENLDAQAEFLKAISDAILKAADAGLDEETVKSLLERACEAIDANEEALA